VDRRRRPEIMSVMETHATFSPEILAELQQAADRAAAGLVMPRPCAPPANRWIGSAKRFVRSTGSGHRRACDPPAARRRRMKWVLDSSVAFKWLVPEADSDKALHRGFMLHGSRDRRISVALAPAQGFSALDWLLLSADCCWGHRNPDAIQTVLR